MYAGRRGHSAVTVSPKGIHWHVRRILSGGVKTLKMGDGRCIVDRSDPSPTKVLSTASVPLVRAISSSHPSAGASTQAVLPLLPPPSPAATRASAAPAYPPIPAHPRASLPRLDLRRRPSRRSHPAADPGRRPQPGPHRRLRRLCRRRHRIVLGLRRRHRHPLDRPLWLHHLHCHPHPTHAYPAFGVYTPVLTVERGTATDTLLHPTYILIN